MTPAKPTRRRFVAAAFAFTFVLATAAVVYGDEIVGDPKAEEPVAVLLEDELDDEQDATEDEEEAAEDAAEDAADAAEDAAEAAEDQAERDAEALEDASDDCATAEEGTHGATVCQAAQSWKTEGLDRPSADHGANVSAAARDNHGAEIARQKEANGGVPDAAANAVANAGPDGNGPPGGGPGSGDDEEEDEEEDEED